MARGKTHLCTVSVKEWATKQVATKQEEYLERPDPGYLRRGVVSELMRLVVLLVNAVEGQYSTT